MAKRNPLALDNPLFIAAVGMHEMFTAYQQAGFTRNEALQLVVAHISAATIVSAGDADGP